MIQTGDPTGTGRGGASIYGLVWFLMLDHNATDKLIMSLHDV